MAEWTERYTDGRVWFEVGGPGPTVLLMHELFGISGDLKDWANDLAGHGFRVIVATLLDPHGRPGRLRNITALCVRKEIHAFAVGKTSPIVNWLKHLAKEAVPPPTPYAVIGMCLSGGFALALAVDNRVPAAIVAQPALPAAILPRQRRDLGLGTDEVNGLRQRLTEPGALQVKAFRFNRDPISPAPRLCAAKDLLGDALEVETVSGSGHSTLTGTGTGVEAARAQVRAFLHERMG